MKSTWCRILVYGWVLGAGGVLFAQEQMPPMQATTGSLFKLEGPRSGWNTGVRLELGKREAAFSDETWALDTRRVTARVGHRVTAASHVWGEVGIALVDRRGRAGAADPDQTDSVSPWIEEDSAGESGLAWGLGGSLVLLEAVLQNSPVLGPQEWLSLELEASYRIGHSDLHPLLHRVWDPTQQRHVSVEGSAEQNTEEFSWRDLKFGPMLVYRKETITDPGRASFLPTGYVVRGGIQFVQSQYTYQDLKEEEGTVGVELGAELRLNSGWMCRLDASWLGATNREVALSLVRYF